MEKTQQVVEYIEKLSSHSQEWITYDEFEAGCGLSIKPPLAERGSLEWDGYTSLRNKELHSFNDLVVEHGLTQTEFFQLLPKYDISDRDFKLRLLTGDDLGSEVAKKHIRKAQRCSQRGVNAAQTLLEHNNNSDGMKSTLLGVKKVLETTAAFTERTSIAMDDGTLKDYAALPSAAIQAALEHKKGEGDGPEADAED